MISLRKYILDAFDDYLGKNKKLKNGILNKKDVLIEKEKISRFYDEPEHIIDLLIWPPNTFIILTNILDKNGNYRRFVSPNGIHGWSKKDLSKATELSETWHKILTLPYEKIQIDDIYKVVTSLQKLFNHDTLKKDISLLLEDNEFITQALTLTIASDEAFKFSKLKNVPKGSVYAETLKQLSVTNEPSKSQLSFSNHHFGTIQRKNTVCQSGISLNSISQHLTNIRPEINLEVLERTNEINSNKDIFNILILPWPMKIDREFFSEVNRDDILEMDENFGFFSYTPKNAIDIDEAVNCSMNAIVSTGDIDLIVFPECALSIEDSKVIATSLYKRCHFMSVKCPSVITGNYENTSHYSRNQITIFSPPEQDPDLPDVSVTPELEPVTQKKHHRWYLDRTQIFNYKLGSNLSPRKKWWEFIDVDERKLITYQCHDNNIQITPLICEDLARQDPVAPAVRALGPTLIIALLLDGPQLKNRWPGRYASFLSEDPGSSVLTVTPLGMTLRSDGSGLKPSRVVSFWSEPSSHRELSLDEGKRSIILTLEKRDILQWTADGRQGERTALHYAGHICL
ncbi:hypothetical protein [Aeromonas dhakensis]|uniref:hypothetical protein n=1 Tax=Aeromonas dhakensis TaxID=196024 RepID=UPI000A9556CE|nr:hypothetical protein [Aeromonas dhakensis]